MTTQVRVSRPRPASWCSATSTVRSGAPAAAAAIRSALVEPVRSHHVQLRPRPDQRGPQGRGVQRPGGDVHAGDATCGLALPPSMRAAVRATGGRPGRPACDAVDELRPTPARDVASATPGTAAPAVRWHERCRREPLSPTPMPPPTSRTSTPPRASWPTCTGAARTRARRQRGRDRAPARQGPADRPRAGRAAARPGLVRRAGRAGPAPLDQLRHGGERAVRRRRGHRHRHRSTAARSRCSARTPPCSAARSARCTARRSSR